MRSLTPAPEERGGKKEEKCLKGGIWLRSADIFTPLYEGSKAAQPPPRLMRSFRFLPLVFLFSLVSSWVNECVRRSCWLMSSDGFTLTNPMSTHQRINQGWVYFCGTGYLFVCFFTPCHYRNSHHHEVSCVCSEIYLGCYGGPVRFELSVTPQNAELADRNSSETVDFQHETKQILSLRWSGRWRRTEAGLWN